MRYFRNNLTKAHVIVFACLLAAFTLLTFSATNAGVDKGSEHNTRVLQATVGAITGPLVGAIARGFQGCCLKFSLTIMAYCAPVLVVGLLMPCMRPADRKWIRVMRMGLWTLGWLAWFMGGMLSFGHALV